MIKYYKAFFKNEAVLGIRSPLDYMYIKIMKFSLKLINSWPAINKSEENSKYLSTMLSSFLTILTFTHVIGGVLYLTLHGKYLTFMEIGYAYITTFMNAVIVSRLLTLTFSKKYRNVAVLFLTRIHLFYFKDNSEYAMKIHKRIHNISHVFTIFLVAQTVAGIIFFCAMPLYNYTSLGCYKDNISRNLTFEISVYIIYPFHTYSSIAEYIFICIFNCIFATLAATWFCMFDLFLSIMVFHVYGHFKILLHKLNNFPKPSQLSCKMLGSYEKYSEIELYVISQLLNDCIEYHKLIVSFTKQMSEAFGTMLFVCYTFHQVSGCLLLLECSQMTAGALVRYVPMTLILYQQLMQLSIIFELIGSTSEKLKHAVYGLPWEAIDVKNRKTVFLLLMNVQEPIHVKALGIANVGVTTMAAILKTSLSYFTFLRSK